MSNFLKQSEEMERRIPLNNLNTYITCNICKGYLIEATAITECLHTFCKSCIIKHFEAKTTCPTCSIVIHHSYPRQYLNFDRTMQDIVYKLVPGLEESEIKREKEFYRTRGLPCPKELPSADVVEEEVKDKLPNECENIVVELPPVREKLISVCLQNADDLKHKMFVRVPIKTTIGHVQKFVAVKVLKSAVQNDMIDVFCDCDPLPKNYSLKFVYVTKWKFDEVPFTLQYKLKL